MKKIIVLLIFTLALTACGGAGKNVNYSNAALQTHYQALEEISYDSDVIVEAELTGKSKDIAYQNASFKVTEFVVNKVLKGDQQLVSNTIQVLEIASFSRNESKNNLLFLEKYVGPVTSSAYVVAGVYQGKFTIDKDNKLIYDAEKHGGMKSFQTELAGLDMKSVEAKVQQAVTNARPPKKLQMSEEQRKKNEEESIKLLEQDRNLNKQ